MQSSPMKKKKRQPGRRRPRRYSPQFKANAVQLSLQGDKPVAVVAKELGIPSQTLHMWVTRHEREQGAVAAAEGESAEAKIKRLEKRVAQLEEEREILKKAATFFAKESE